MAIHQLVHQLVAQAFDVHGAARGKVQEGFLALRRAEQPAGATVVGLDHRLPIEQAETAKAHRG